MALARQYVGSALAPFKRAHPFGENVREWLADATAPFREAPLTHEIVMAAHELPLRHQDPADRFLAATAGQLGLTLVTADDRLLGLGSIATLANR